MCGLVGYAGDILIKHKEAFELLLLLDQIRGFDSTGVASIDKDENVKTLKKAIVATDFIDLKRYSKLLSGFDHKVLLGHNRAATKGAVTNENAHPFTVGDITLCHNGTLRNQSLLPDHKEYKVDSENICHAINEDGAAETIKNLCGAFALTWYDTNSKTLNMVRNEERPLFYVYTKDKKSIFWASEKWMLTVALRKNTVDFEDIQELPVGKLLTFDFNKYRCGTLLNTKASLKEVEMYVPKTVVTTSGNGTGTSYANILHKDYVFEIEERTVINKYQVEYTGVTECGCDVKIKTNANLTLEVGAFYKGRPTKRIWRENQATLEFTGFNLKKLEDPLIIEGEGDEETSDNFLDWNGSSRSRAFVQQKLDKGCGVCGQKTDYLDAFVLNDDEYICDSCCDIPGIEDMLGVKL